MGGTLVKVAIGGFLMWLSSQMGGVAERILGRVRESVQASELKTLDGHLAVWAIEQKHTRPPKDQDEFERVLQGLFTSRADRDVTRDRWGQPYLYQAIGSRPVRWRIASSGPDQRVGTADDLVVERNGDHVDLSKDPVALAEGALALERDHDAAVLERLAALRAKLDGASSETTAEPPLFDERSAPQGPKGPTAEQLRRSLADLDRLLG